MFDDKRVCICLFADGSAFENTIREDSMAIIPTVDARWACLAAERLRNEHPEFQALCTALREALTADDSGPRT